MALVKKIVKEENSDVPSKKLKIKVNGLNKSLKKNSFKDIFRRLTGVMFSQISQEGRFAQVNLNEDEEAWREDHRDTLNRIVPVRQHYRVYTTNG